MFQRGMEGRVRDADVHTDTQKDIQKDTYIDRHIDTRTYIQAQRHTYRNIHETHPYKSF